jgi:glycosyltransferase involved in cell wall biosynthesis
MLDLLARGLAELGHEVFYALQQGTETPLPDGVVAADESMAKRVDVVHHQRLSPYQCDDLGAPYVRTVHADLSANRADRERLALSDHWIYVSRALARAFGSERFIHNGIDPAELVYSAGKGEYFLFVAALERAWEKGLDVALDVAAAAGRELVIAGSADSTEAWAKVEALCRGHRVRLVGEVKGAIKAELFAGARALLMPSRAPEAFGMAAVEALASGTPVICSDQGGLPEIVTSEVGFVCRDLAQMRAAAQQIGTIDPVACRERALAHFHYSRMAADYVREYEETVARFG